MPTLNKMQTMRLYQRLDHQLLNTKTGFRLMYSCRTDADRDALEEQIRLAVAKVPPLDRKTLELDFIKTGFGMNVEVSFQTTAAFGLANQNFTGADLLKIAGTFEDAGVIDINVKKVMQGAAAAQAAPMRGVSKP